MRRIDTMVVPRRSSLKCKNTKDEPRPPTLTQAMQRVMRRLANDPAPFTVFYEAPRLFLVHTNTPQFRKLSQRNDLVQIASYDHRAKVSDVLDDLREIFTDEVE